MNRDLAGFVRAVGLACVGLGGLAIARPRALAEAAGVRSAGDASLPVLVRLAAARQVVLGLALLTRSPVDVRRSAGLFLPLTALDAAAVLGGTRQGVLARRSAVLSLVVLATNAALVGVSGSRPPGRSPRPASRRLLPGRRAAS